MSGHCLSYDSAVTTVPNRDDPFDLSSLIGAEMLCVSFTVNTVHLQLERGPGEMVVLTVYRGYALSRAGLEIEREQIPPAQSTLMSLAGRAVVGAQLTDSMGLALDLGESVVLTCLSGQDGYESFCIERAGEVWAF